MIDPTGHRVNYDPGEPEFSKQPHNRCPVCGYEFDPVEVANVCPRHGNGKESFSADELIGEWDDCAYDL